ncbi:MAG: hypothetical protein U5L96_00680 [Owenweeksia sp.]|nr:hypothetical protein [Owenweeksia sp.]
MKFEIDRKRLRKKLKAFYLKEGREFSETFSITLLSNKKIQKLAREGGAHCLGKERCEWHPSFI